MTQQTMQAYKNFCTGLYDIFDAFLPGGGGWGYSTMLCTGMIRPEVHPLPIYTPNFDQKGTLHIASIENWATFICLL